MAAEAEAGTSKAQPWWNSCKVGEDSSEKLHQERQRGCSSCCQCSLQTSSILLQAIFNNAQRPNNHQLWQIPASTRLMGWIRTHGEARKKKGDGKPEDYTVWHILFIAYLATSDKKWKKISDWILKGKEGKLEEKLSGGEVINTSLFSHNNDLALK